MGFSLVAVSRGYSSLQFPGFLIAVASLSQSTGSRVNGLHHWQFSAPEHRLKSCGAPVELLHSMWDLPRPGIEPTSPALAGRFFTTEPAGKPRKIFLLAVRLL